MFFFDFKVNLDSEVFLFFFLLLFGLLRATVHCCRFAEDQESKEEDPKKG